MSNVAGKAYGMNVVTPMRPCLTWINRALFMASRAIPSSLKGFSAFRSSISRAGSSSSAINGPISARASSRCRTTTCCSAAISTERGTSISTRFPTAFLAGSICSGYSSTKYPHSIPISPFKRLHPGKPDRHRLLLQFGPGRRPTRHQGSIARPARNSRIWLPSTPRLVSGGIPEAVHHDAGRGVERRHPDRGAERSRLPGLCPGREHRYRERGAEPRGLRCQSATGRRSAPVNRTSARPRNDPMPTFDGGHYFLTVLVPIRTSAWSRTATP